jgi:DUF1009 family protein
MAGAGVLPGRAAAEARRLGWRVAAFTFDDTPGLAEVAHEVVPSRITDIRAVLDGLRARHVEAAVFVGTFWKAQAFAAVDRTDAPGRQLAQAGLSDSALAQMVVATLGGLGIEVLDPRQFLAPWLLPPGVLTGRSPREDEWRELRVGLGLARHLAGYGIGQTVVRARGVTVAVEASEGTDETIRRGTRLAGPGAVVVKAVAPSHDYRFDIPTIGAATIEAMAAGGATALGVEGGKMLLVDRAPVVRLADEAGIAVVSLDGDP